MIGADPARFVLAALQLPIFEIQFDGPQHRLAHDLEKFEVGRARAGAAEGDDILQIGPGKGDAILQAIGDFSESRVQRTLEGRPLVLRERFCATNSAVISPSETSMLGNPVTASV